MAIWCDANGRRWNTLWWNENTPEGGFVYYAYDVTCRSFGAAADPNHAPGKMTATLEEVLNETNGYRRTPRRVVLSGSGYSIDSMTVCHEPVIALGDSFTSNWVLGAQKGIVPAGICDALGTKFAYPRWVTSFGVPGTSWIEGGGAVVHGGFARLGFKSKFGPDNDPSYNNNESTPAYHAAGRWPEAVYVFFGPCFLGDTSTQAAANASLAKSIQYTTTAVSEICSGPVTYDSYGRVVTQGGTVVLMECLYGPCASQAENAIRNGQVRKYNTFLHYLAAAAGTPVAAVCDAMSDSQISGLDPNSVMRYGGLKDAYRIAHGNVHPNAAGHEFAAQKAAEAVEAGPPTKLPAVGIPKGQGVNR